MAFLTLGSFREQTKDLPDDVAIDFFYRENFFDPRISIRNDGGEDYVFIPETIWFPEVDEEDKDAPYRIALVSIKPPIPINIDEDDDDSTIQ